MGAVHLDGVDAEPLGALRGQHERLAHARKARRVERQSAASRPPCAGSPTAPPAASRLRTSGISWPPSHGVWLDALRPAWASWIITAALERLRTEARIGFSAASLESL